MIPYSTGRWGFSWTMFQFRGSVIPKAVVWAFPTSMLSVLMWHLIHERDEASLPQSIRKDVAQQTLAGFAMVLGFLLVFRTQKAYGRYWECAMFLQKARGEWFNAASNLVSFCSIKADHKEQVILFQQQLVRLISLLFCHAISEVADQEPDFQVLDVSMISKQSLAYLQEQKSTGSETVMQWIQRLIVNNIRNGVIDIAPPIVSRVFQEFSLGIVNISSAKKVTLIPFPFPYAQMMTVLLLMQAIFVPCIAGFAFHDWWVAATHTFVSTLLTWSIHYIAIEIEMPFGDDPNDLPMDELITSMNDSLIKLLDDEMQKVPAFDTHCDMVLRIGTWDGKEFHQVQNAEGKLSKTEAKDRSQMKEPISSEAPPAPVLIDVAKPAAQAAAKENHAPAPSALPAAAAAGPRPSDAELVKHLADISKLIEAHLSAIGSHLGACPRIDEKLTRISEDIGGMSKVGSRLMDKMDTSYGEELLVTPADQNSKGWSPWCRQPDPTLKITRLGRSPEPHNVMGQSIDTRVMQKI